MRAIIILLGLSIAAHTARAESVVVLSGEGELDVALRVAMAGRGVMVARAQEPVGGIRFERAAVAQHEAVQLGAEAAVWVDEAEICAVTADGHEFRHAPFPSDVASPRAFAAIATSLLDEMIHPDAWQGFNVDVDVRVTPTGPGPAPVAFAGPAFDAPGVVAPQPIPDGRAHMGHTLLEIGPMVSPLTVGLQGALAFPVSDAWRIALAGAINTTFDKNFVLGVGSAELRHVGIGQAKHWDIGPELGYATDGTDPATFAGARIARTWESSSTAMSLAFTPMLVHVMAADAPIVFPAIYASLRWQVPL